MTDNLRSCFWLAWEIPGANRLDSAMVTGDSANTAWGPVETPQNATIKIKLAWGLRGLYVLFEVIDDTWIGYVSPNDYQYDAVELFLDPHSGQELYGANTPLFPNINISQLTRSYSYFQVRIGGNEPAERLAISQWNPNVDSSCAQPSQCVLYYEDPTIAGVDLEWGLKIESIPPRGNETNIRRQEWMIPWGIYGSPPGKDSIPAIGDKLAMCFGYNDLDSASEPSASAIRWRNAADPYTTAANAATGLTATVDSWGEIQFAGDLNAAANVTDADLNAACAQEFPDACKTPIFRPESRLKIQSAEYFTLTGQRVGNLHALPAHAAVLERCMLGNGAIVVRRITMR